MVKACVRGKVLDAKGNGGETPAARRNRLEAAGIRDAAEGYRTSLTRSLDVFGQRLYPPGRSPAPGAPHRLSRSSLQCQHLKIVSLGELQQFVGTETRGRLRVAAAFE